MKIARDKNAEKILNEFKDSVRTFSRLSSKQYVRLCTNSPSLFAEKSG